MNCVFCSILEKNDPHHEIIWRGDGHIIFVPNEPNRLGHILVVPQRHIPYAFDMDEEAYTKLLLLARRAAIRLKKVTPCARIALIIDGMSVPHVHVHLMPVDESGDFCKPGLENVTKEILVSIGDILRKGFEGFIPAHEV